MTPNLSNIPSLSNNYMHFHIKLDRNGGEGNGKLDKTLEKYEDRYEKND